MVHLRNEFYLSDSEGLLITAISPEWKEIAILCCLFYIRWEYYFNKSSIFFSMIYHNSSFQDPEVRRANVAAAWRFGAFAML
jgi:hypothetical protein